MDRTDYIVKSLELHLFFARIMKEHAIFLKAGFAPVSTGFIREAEFYKDDFEKLLCKAVKLSNGIVSWEALCSSEVVTQFTQLAEQQTERFTGIAINREITEKELELTSRDGRCHVTEQQYCQVQSLNKRAVKLLEGLICFKETILNNVLSCNMFTMNYPLLIEHIIKEARLYLQYVQMLETDEVLSYSSMKEMECFWNHIMMDHAEFIRGLLDPTEADLLRAAEGFSEDYCGLLKVCNTAEDCPLTSQTLQKTMEFRDFKMAATEGIEQCNLRSVILPLLADHVLREANHYIRLLQYEH